MKNLLIFAADSLYLSISSFSMPVPYIANGIGSRVCVRTEIGVAWSGSTITRKPFLSLNSSRIVPTTSLSKFSTAAIFCLRSPLWPASSGASTWTKTKSLVFNVLRAFLCRSFCIDFSVFHSSLHKDVLKFHVFGFH